MHEEDEEEVETVVIQRWEHRKVTVDLDGNVEVDVDEDEDDIILRSRTYETEIGVNELFKLLRDRERTSRTRNRIVKAATVWQA